MNAELHSKPFAGLAQITNAEINNGWLNSEPTKTLDSSQKNEKQT